MPKAGSEDVRLVTDFTHLNRYVIRPVHPFPSALDITRKIKPGARFLAKMDATKGYHQLQLDEDSRKLTTFLLPSGKFRYKRGPMGLSSTGDIWCQKSDAAILGLSNCAKIVDDIITAAHSIPELEKLLRQILIKARQIGLTISKKKFRISTTVKFAGYAISSDGVKPDPVRVEAIRNFQKFDIPGCLLYTSDAADE